MNSDVRFRKLSNMGGDEPFKSYGKWLKWLLQKQ